MRGDLGFVEDADAFDEAVAVERRYLVARERPRVFDAERVEAQVALDPVEFIVVGDDLELWLCFHRNFHKTRSYADVGILFPGERLRR